MIKVFEGYVFEFFFFFNLLTEKPLSCKVRKSLSSRKITKVQVGNDQEKAQSEINQKES